MKKLLLAFAMVCLCMVAKAQESEYVYCQIVGTGKMFSTKVSVQIDFGQATSFWKGGAEKVLRDETGKRVDFNSMVDALNFMGAKGWEFVQAYAITVNQQNVYHFLMKMSKAKAQAQLDAQQ